MRTSKGFLFLLVLVGLLLITAPVLAATTDQTVSVVGNNTMSRLAGQDRYQTARAVSEYYNNGTVENVVLTTGSNFADALASSVLAHALNAPILLVNPTAAQSTEAFNYIAAHLDKAGKVYIIGGTGLIGSDFRTKLNQMGYNNITQLGGKDRYETDSMIAQDLNVSTGGTIVVASGENYPDALSISSVAANKGWPIMLVPAKTLPEKIKDYITQAQPSQIYITGGVGVVSSTVQAQIQALVPGAKITRLAGNDRFATDAKVIQTFAPNPQKLYLATGFGFADALAGSAVAAKTGEPIILVNPTATSLSPDILNYIAELHSTNINPDIISFGGAGAVPDQLGNSAYNTLYGVSVPGFTIDREKLITFPTSEKYMVVGASKYETTSDGWKQITDGEVKVLKYDAQTQAWSSIWSSDNLSGNYADPTTFAFDGIDAISSPQLALGVVSYCTGGNWGGEGTVVFSLAPDGTVQDSYDYAGIVDVTNDSINITEGPGGRHVLQIADGQVQDTVIPLSQMADDIPGVVKAYFTLDDYGNVVPVGSASLTLKKGQIIAFVPADSYTANYFDNGDLSIYTNAWNSQDPVLSSHADQLEFVNYYQLTDTGTFQFLIQDATSIDDGAPTFTVKVTS